MDDPKQKTGHGQPSTQTATTKPSSGEESQPYQPKNPSAPFDKILSRFKAQTPEQEAQHEADRERITLTRKRDRFLSLSRALESSLGARYSRLRCDLDKFQIYDKKQATALAEVRAVISTIKATVEAGDGVMLIGQVGTGKDYLLAALLYAAAEELIPVKHVNAQEVFGGFRDRIDTGDSDEDYFRSLIAPDVLGLSDPIPPTGSVGNWDVQNLYRIIDRRYKEMKSTWVSLNAVNIEEVTKQLSAPVFDRLRHNARIIPCFWPSYRARG